MRFALDPTRPFIVLASGLNCSIISSCYLRLRLPQEGNCIFYATFVMNEFIDNKLADYETALADFVEEKSPLILMDRGLEIEWLQIIILYLIKKYRISNSDFRKILKEILEGP